MPLLTYKQEAFPVYILLKMPVLKMWTRNEMLHIMIRSFLDIIPSVAIALSQQHTLRETL